MKNKYFDIAVLLSFLLLLNFSAQAQEASKPRESEFQATKNGFEAFLDNRGLEKKALFVVSKGQNTTVFVASWDGQTRGDSRRAIHYLLRSQLKEVRRENKQAKGQGEAN